MFICPFSFVVINVFIAAAASPKELAFTEQLCRHLVFTSRSFKDDFIYSANSDDLANQSDL